ncbi:putative deacetylase [Lyophyllum shimeji]|uniref:Histone deacetylase 8 n=1 Tax=Lyophyllum shimeji TaxID=47721 RepID=A0A9P3PMX9_LYOSH|nr:putative deacetylase [Lyophyllum shimeji]
MADRDRVVAYIVSAELIAASSQLPSNKQRSSTIHSLIHELGLSKRVKVIRPVRASYKELAAYHTREYLDAVLAPQSSDAPKTPHSLSSHPESDFGLDSDCPPFPALPAYVPLVAGASLTAAQALINGVAPVAICWDGGRHHAQKGHAAGFCYVADCVLALMALKRAPPIAPCGRKPRIMYIDLDLHFSDAVSQAFASSSSTRIPQILTLSIHHAAPGFYPPSELATLPDPSSPSFNPFTLSLPLRAGAGPSTLARIWPLVQNVKDVFSPDYIVMQCGVDALSGDPCGVSNWSLEGLGNVVRDALAWGVPVLLLGGGGYNTPNAARAWASLTSIALNDPLPLDTPIPDHAAFPLYAPSFILDVPAGTMQDQNSDAYLRDVEERFAEVVRVLKTSMAPRD